MAASRIVLGLEDYGLPFRGLRGIWGVQRWIEGERRKEREGEGEGVEVLEEGTY